MKNVKRIVAFVLLAAFVIALSACGSASTPSSNVGNNVGSDAPVDAGEEAVKVEWKFATAQKPGSLIHNAYTELISRLEEETDGNFIIHMYDSGTLGTDKEVIVSAQTGAIDMCTVTTSTLSNFAPIAGGLVMPYLVTDWEDLKLLCKDENVIKLIDAELEDMNVSVAALYATGFRMYVGDVPVYTMDDFDGIKIRVAESDLYLAIFQALGAYPIGLPNTELITSLQQGVIDAVENTVDTNYADGIYEFCDYISGTNHTFNTQSCIVSDASWEALPDEYREILERLMDECFSDLVNKAEESVDYYIGLLEENGMTYNEVAPEDLAEMQAVCREIVWPQFEDQYKELLDAITSSIG